MNIQNIINKYQLHGRPSLDRWESRFFSRVSKIYHDATNDNLNDSKPNSVFSCVTSDDYGNLCSEKGDMFCGLHLKQWGESDEEYKNKIIDNLDKILKKVRCYSLSTNISDLRKYKKVLFSRQWDKISDYFAISKNKKNELEYRHKIFWIIDGKNNKRSVSITENNLLSVLAKIELFGFCFKSIEDIYSSNGNILLGAIINDDLHSGDARLPDAYQRKCNTILNALCESMYGGRLLCLNTEAKTYYNGQFLADNLCGMLNLANTNKYLIKIINEKNHNKNLYFSNLENLLKSYKTA